MIGEGAGAANPGCRSLTGDARRAASPLFRVFLSLGFSCAALIDRHAVPLGVDAEVDGRLTASFGGAVVGIQLAKQMPETEVEPHRLLEAQHYVDRPGPLAFFAGRRWSIVAPPRLCLVLISPGMVGFSEWLLRVDYLLTPPVRIR